MRRINPEFWSEDMPEPEDVQMDPDSTVLCRNADRNTSKV